MVQNRRQFVMGSVAAAAPMVLSSSARGANDRPSYALIACGNRGRWLSQAFQSLDARCVGLCDVYEPYLELAKTQSPPDAKAYGDYREVLAQKNIDFVVIASPDHHHCPMLLDSLAAGKDVYIEKPLSLNLEQSAKMVAAVRKSDRIVQVGMQRRSMEFIRKAKKLIDDDVIGKVSMVKAMWNWHFDMPLDSSELPGKLDWARFLGPAPKRPLDPVRFRWWRGFWDYSGGNMTDQGTHLMDVVQWMTNSGPPVSAVCQGKVLEVSGVEAPNVFSAAFEYRDFMATWTLNYRSSYEHDWSILFQGEKAALFIDRKGYRLYKDAGISAKPWTQKGDLELIGELPDTDKPEAHQQNFLDCIRSRQQPNCPVEIAAAAVAGPHMANIAWKKDKKVKLDASGMAS